MSGETVVRFVRQDSSQELLEKAYEESVSSEGTCVWMSEEECLAITAKDRKSVFIFERFEGAAFENVVKTKNRIYGPMVILSCMKSGSVLPKMSHPVHNLSMLNFIISCTCLDKAVREAVHRHIQYMCGEVSKDFFEKVSHLIAGEVGSKKYIVAASLGKPIMSPEWVQKVWEDSQTRFCSPDSEAYKAYRCKVFPGCVITVTGLEPEERAEVRDLIEKEGGRYTGEMKMKECTHLITNTTKGKKYQFATLWKIPIVKPLWLFDSVEAGCLLDTKKYKVTPDGGTPSDTSTNTNLTSTPTAVDNSRISLSNAPDISCISVGPINETTFNHTRRLSDSDPLDDLDFGKVKPGMFLDGCKIFLSGFGGVRLEKIRRLINLGGGTRFSQINETISHVVMGDRVEAHVKLLQEGQLRLSAVSVDWVVACCQAGNQVSEEPYLCLELPTIEPVTPIPKKRKPSMPPPAEPAKQPREDPDQTVAVEADDMAELLSQYMPNNTDMTDESALVRAAEAAEQRRPTQNGDDATQDPTLEPEESQEGGIFSNKKFALVGLRADEEQELVQFIEEADGVIVGNKSRAVPDFAVVPVLGCPVTLTATEIVTTAYVQICMENEELLPVTANPMFTPVSLRDDAEPLTGCVLSISGYSGMEREVLMHIAEILGAMCQDFFVKQSKRKLHASTHLVVNAATGTKYEAAKKWNLPAVDRSWIFECARTGKRVPEERYAVDRDHNATAETTMTEEPEAPPPRAATPTEGPDPTPVSPISPNNLDKENRATGSNHVEKMNIAVPEKEKKAEINRLPNQRVKALIDQTKQETPRQKKEEKAGIDTPGKFLNPGVSYQAQFDLADFMSALDTPEGRKKHQRKSSLPLDEVFSKNMAIALKNSSAPQKMPVTPAPARRTMVEQSFLKEGQAGPLHGVKIAVSRKLSAQQSELQNVAADLGADYCWTYDQSCTHFIFQGRRNDTTKEFRIAREHGKIIVSPYWITMCKEQNAHVDESLFPHDYNPSLSLAVTSAKKETSSRQTTRRSTRSRVKEEEAASPALSRPTRSRTKITSDSDNNADISVKSVRTVSPAKRKVAEKEDNAFEDLDKTCSDEEMAAACQDMEAEEQTARKRAVPPTTQPANTLAREAFVDDLTNLMAATKTYSKGKRRSRRTDSLSGEVAEEPETKRISLSRSSNKSEDSDTSRGSGKERRPTRSSLRSRSGKRSEISTEPSQMVEVTWDDPETRQQQEKLAAELAKNSESFSPLRGGLTSDEDQHTTTTDEEPAAPPAKETATLAKPEEAERIKTPEPPSLAIPTARVPQPETTDMMEDQQEMQEDQDATTEEKPPPIFLFSGMSQQERADYGALVEQLGGRVSDASTYDKNCTHLVVGSPTRNEKYLSCVAAGKWVLHKSYLEACRQENRFIDEEDHEWGSEATQAILAGLPAHIGKLARAAHRWRRQVAEEGGAFSNWTCILLADKKKEEGLIRLLHAGGATMKGTRPPFSNLEEINFAFMDISKSNKKVDVEEFLAAGVHCVKPDYIASYLMEDPLPRPQNYYIAEVTGGASDISRKRKPSGVETPNSKRSRLQ